MDFKKDLVIGVDVSTTAAKAIVWDLQGRIISAERKSIPMINLQSDWYEQSADDWWGALSGSLQTICSETDPSRLTAICICSQRETFVPVNQHGNPIRNAILWMDERARDLLPVIESTFNLEQFHQITGKPLSGNLTVAKLLWLKENEPDIFEHTSRFLDVAAYLNFKLTGKFVTGWGIADPTGLFDMSKNQWSLPIIDFLGLDQKQLPLAFSAGSIIGQVTSQAAQLCGLPEGLSVIAGLGDGQAAGLGANITQPGKTYLSLGTSVVTGTYAQNYITDRAFRTMYAGGGAFSLETVLLGGTFTLGWLREKFAIDTPLTDLENLCRTIPPGTEGLIVVPYWNSVMNPYWDAAASGITIGWRSHHGPAHFYRAILEGIAFELRLHFESVEKALQHNIEQIIAMGGGADSDLWCQIIADVSGRTIQRAHMTEATALGAGILASLGAGLFSDAAVAARNLTDDPKDNFIPNHEHHKVYSRLYEQVYKPLFPMVQPVMHLLETG